MMINFASQVSCQFLTVFLEIHNSQLTIHINHH